MFLYQLNRIAVGARVITQENHIDGAQFTGNNKSDVSNTDPTDDDSDIEKDSPPTKL